MPRYFPRLLLLIAASALVLTHCEQGISLGMETDDKSGLKEETRARVQYRFAGDEDHRISPETAEQLIVTFQDNNPFTAHAWYFGSQAIKMILAQDGCVGIRIHGGMSSEGKFRPVIYGVTASGNDIGRFTLKKGIVDSMVVMPMDIAYPCPPYCGGFEDNGK